MSDLYKLTVGTRVGSETGEIDSAMNVQVESAIKDDHGNNINSTYVKKVTSFESGNDVINTEIKNADTSVAGIKTIVENETQRSISSITQLEDEVDVNLQMEQNEYSLKYNGDLTFEGKINNSVIFQNDGVTVKKATEATDAQNSVYADFATSAGHATSAGNSTYATKIGSSSSHPSIGNKKTPVYVKSTGAIDTCEIGQKTLYKNADILVEIDVPAATYLISPTDTSLTDYGITDIDQITTLSLWGYPTDGTTTQSKIFLTGAVGFGGHVTLSGISGQNLMMLEAQLETTVEDSVRVLTLSITKMFVGSGYTNTHFRINNWLIKANLVNTTVHLN